MGKGPIVVKLGGSAISDKGVPFSYRGEVVARLGRAMASCGRPVVVVHGGGSFGHPLARRFGLGSSAASRSSAGVAETRRAMFDLDSRVCASLLEAGLRPYAFSPFPLLSALGRAAAPWLEGLTGAGMTPVTFGDVVREGTGFRVLSGDAIASELSSLLRAERCVFVVDVDGVLDRRGEVIGSVDRASAARMRAARSTDATGGMRAKVAVSIEMAARGTEVAFVSGFSVPDFRKALKGQRFHGSVARVPSRAKE